MPITWGQCRPELTSDGALRDIQVIDAAADDWGRVLSFIRSGASKLDFIVDGEAAALPYRFEEILAVRAIATPALLFRWADLEFATHFFGPDDLEFDFRPEDVPGQAQLDQLLSFLSRLGRCVRKTITVYHEGWEVNPFFLYSPEADAISYIPQNVEPIDSFQSPAA